MLGHWPPSPALPEMLKELPLGKAAIRKIKRDSSHFKDGLIAVVYNLNGGSHPHLILQASVLHSKL